jgi:hypothetical protein
VPCSDEILREYLRRYEESSGVLNERVWAFTNPSDPPPFTVTPGMLRTLEMLPIWSSFKGTTPKIKLFQT